MPPPPGRPNRGNEVPARCMRCGLAALMPVRRLVHRVDHSKRGTVWQVDCPQCGPWTPGYPLSTPRYLPPGRAVCLQDILPPPLPTHLSRYRATPVRRNNPRE